MRQFKPIQGTYRNAILASDSATVAPLALNPIEDEIPPQQVVRIEAATIWIRRHISLGVRVQAAHARDRSALAAGNEGLEAIVFD